MNHPSLASWEKDLHKILNKLDDALEDRYGGAFKLHPARAQRGRTSNKAYDGLFSVQANFSLGIGSQYGRGYVLDIDLATLENIPRTLLEEIETFALNKLREYITTLAPDKQLRVAKDGHIIKIFGDLHLGTVY